MSLLTILNEDNWLHNGHMRENDAGVSCDNAEATRFCVIGAILKLYPWDVVKASEASGKLKAYLWASTSFYGSLAGWNDKATWAEVEAAIKGAGV